MKCTHVALQVRSLARSVAFYERFCGMRIVHQREETTPVAWMGWGEDPPRFVIVLLERDYTRNEQPEWQHIGMAVESRAEVARLHALAVADGAPVTWPPTDAGEIVGYYCGIRDPDGNMVEFSFGQRIG